MAAVVSLPTSRSNNTKPHRKLSRRAPLHALNSSVKPWINLSGHSPADRQVSWKYLPTCVAMPSTRASSALPFAFNSVGQSGDNPLQQRAQSSEASHVAMVANPHIARGWFFAEVDEPQAVDRVA